MNYIEEYYNNYDEDNRLLRQHSRVEYMTTMRYIKQCISKLPNPEDATILEVGAGTGRYSLTLVQEGYSVVAVDLVQHNLDILKSKLDGSESIIVMKGNALDLSTFIDNAFDITLVLGPLYHLYTKEDKLQALREAVRVTKPGGYILVAYCMNDPTIVKYVFGLNHLHETLDKNLISDDWKCESDPKEVFELVRTEDIAELDSELPVERIKLVATDGASNYNTEMIDEMDDNTFNKWVLYHFAVCERQDLIGASHHTLDILQKR